MARKSKAPGLELHRSGFWGVRYRDPHKRHPDGRPKYAFKLLRTENGERVSSKVQASELCAAFMATLPPPPTRSRASVAPIAGMTLEQLATLWHAHHDRNVTRDDGRDNARRLATLLGATYASEITVAKVDQWKLDHKRRGLRNGANLRTIIAWGIEKRHVPAVPADVLDALASPQSKRSRKPSMGVPEWERVMAVAETAGHLPLFHCMSLYGWRPVTACRLTVGDVDLRRASVSLNVKRKPGDDEPCVHTLTPQTIELLRPLVEGRGPDEAVFLTRQRGQAGMHPWRIDKGCKANQLSQWYRDACKSIAPECGGVYALKRFAIWRMRKGYWPWPETMDDSLIVQFTGHRIEEQVALYRKTSADEMYRMVGQLDGLGEDPAHLLRVSRFGGGGESAVAKKSAALIGGDLVVKSDYELQPDEHATYA